jgi:hypothetical protein
MYSAIKPHFLFDDAFWSQNTPHKNVQQIRSNPNSLFDLIIHRLGLKSPLSNLVMASNTQKIQEMVDKPDRLLPRIGREEVAMVGPVGASHINFRGVLHFPMEEFGQPILRATVSVPARL